MLSVVIHMYARGIYVLCVRDWRVRVWLVSAPGRGLNFPAPNKLYQVWFFMALNFFPSFHLFVPQPVKKKMRTGRTFNAIENILRIFYWKIPGKFYDQGVSQQSPASTFSHQHRAQSSGYLSQMLRVYSEYSEYRVFILGTSSIFRTPSTESNRVLTA